MNILFVSTWFPYPLDNGSRIRVHYLLRALAERHEVRLIAFLPGEEEAAFIPTLEEWGVRLDFVKRDPFWRDRRKALLGHLSSRPRDVVSGYSLEMARLVSEATSRQQYDTVIASVAEVAPYALGVAGIPRILEEHNYMTSWMEEQYRAQRNPARRLLRWMTWQKRRRYECWLYPQFDGCSMVSEKDRRAVQSTIPEYTGKVEVIPNGVDLEWNQPGLSEPRPDTLVFNGSLTYYANADAMQFFASDILPYIQRQRPGVTLDVTGQMDGVDLAWLPRSGSVRPTGYLEDVRPAVAGSWACVVPLRIGGGTRLKILEALALGTPVIATSKGAEGLDLAAGHEILIADSPEQFAACTLEVLVDQGLRARLAQAGRRAVEERYGWKAIGSKMDGWLQSVVALRQAAQAAKGLD